MGVWDTLRVYDRNITADPKDRFVQNGRLNSPTTQVTPDYKDRFLGGGSAAPTVNLTTSTPTPYTDQFLRPQVTTPSAQVPSTVPAAARPAAAREVARRVATTPAPRPVPMSQPTVTYGGGAAYPTEGEALMTELLAANAAPAAPVNPIADNGFVGPELGTNGVTVMDSSGTRQVAVPQGATGRPMDEGFVGRYAAAGKNGQIVLADGAGTPQVIYKDPNAIPEGLFAGVPGVQGNNLRVAEALTAAGQYPDPASRISDIIATGGALGKDYGVTQQGDLFGAEAAATPVKAQAAATGAKAQLIDAGSNATYRAGMLPIERIKADAAMKQATTKENNPNGKTSDERKTERWQNQYKTNLAAVNSDIANMKLPFDQKAAKATQTTDQQLGIGAQAGGGNIAPVGTKVAKKGGGFYTSDGKGGWY